MDPREASEMLLQQMSVPARRDYQLRSFSLKADGKHVSAASQSTRAVSFNAAHKDVPFTVATPRGFFSGPLISMNSQVSAERPSCTAATTGHMRKWSESDVSFATPEDGGSGSESFRLEGSQEQDSLSAWGERSDFLMAPPVKQLQPVVDNVEGTTAPGLRKLAGAPAGKPSGQDMSSPIISNEKPNRLPPSRSWAAGGELHMVRSTQSRPACKREQLAQTKAESVERQRAMKCSRGAGSEKEAGDSRRRPTASIAWDSLNKSQENSPQHDLAAVPFQWEEAPGKPKTIAAAAERAMARRLLREGGEKKAGSSKAKQLQLGSADHVQKSSSEAAYAAAAAADRLGRRVVAQASPNSSFRSSHRFYARTAPGERSFSGPRSSVDSAHVISEVETEARIDLVAPAAAKFLVESWISPNVTPEQNLTTIPFKWEEAPGKPKADEAAESNKPPQLQLPPRLAVVPPSESHSRELRGRNRVRSVSGPLVGYSPLTSPIQRREQQQQHQSSPVMRSCSPSKRSISPSKIHALAKHLSRRVTNSAATQETSFYELVESRNSRYTYTSGPLEDGRDRGASPRALVRSASGALMSASTACELQEYPFYRPKHEKHSLGPTFTSGPLLTTAPSAASSSKRASSPSRRSISPSRIQALAKQLTRKASPAASDCRLEDPNWPVPFKQHRHSSTKGYKSGPLDRSATNSTPAAAEYTLDRSCSGTGSLESPTVSTVSNIIPHDSSESTTSSDQPWLEKQQWSPTSTLQGPSGYSQTLTSVRSSASDTDPYIHTLPLSVDVSKSLSCVSYESFEHSFTEHASPTSQSPPSGDVGPTWSELGSPYLGPTVADYRMRGRDSSGGASEGVKAIIKLCRTGSNWRKGKLATHSPEMWAPTLASYFQSVEAAMGDVNLGSGPALANPQQHEAGPQVAGPAETSPRVSVEAPTRLPYTMPSLPELKLASGEYCCDTSKADFSSCLGVKLSPARFTTKAGDHWPGQTCAVSWGDRDRGHSAPTNNVEDGYRSPAYTATLELLSPSAELFSKKKKVLGKSRSVKLVLPSSNLRRKTRFIVSLVTFTCSQSSSCQHISGTPLIHHLRCCCLHELFLEATTLLQLIFLLYCNN